MTEKAFINTVTEDERIIKKNAVKMLLVVVCILSGVIFSEGGYLRLHLPFGIPVPLPLNHGFLKDQLLPRPIKYAVQDVPKKDVSYTLSFEDYLYLKRHKLEGQDSPFNPDPLEPETIITDIKGNHKHDQVRHGIPCSDSLLKRSAVPNSIVYNNIIGSPVEPEVHKHVYFHVPPPDFEETPATRVIESPSRKNINILFIKVPSYEPSKEYLQKLLQNQQAIQEKTLIYVLSKQEEAQQPVVLPTKPSAPEVYFIKYKTPNNIVEPINDELSASGLLHNVSPVLERF